MLPEQQFYHWLRDNIKGDIVRIESVVGQGIPDVNICYNGCEAWVELKVAPPNSVLLRPEQLAWGMRRSNHGGNCFVVAKHPETPVINVWSFPHVEAKPSGKYARIVNPASVLLDYNGRQLMKTLFPMF